MKIDNKIEMVSCPRNGKNCHEHLYVINNHFKESIIYQGEKNYRRSVELLKSAFDETLKLQKPTCTRCAEFYRSTIIETLEDTHTDLHKMSNGFFRSGRYKESFILAENVLMDMKRRASILQRKNSQNIAS